MKTAVSIFVLASCALSAVGAVPVYSGPVQAVECRARSGIGNVMGKIRAGGAVKVAYFGGSITEMDGWRRTSREWLQSRYPACSFSEIAAAIGGTGSPLGVYRFAQDVMDKNPDLIFVEFATNDASLAPEEIWRNFDGFIRQAWKRNPAVDFVFTYTITQAMTNDYGRGFCPRAASAMEQLADYYGIPSICFGPRVMADVASGKLVMTIGEFPTAVPAETPDRDNAIIAEMAAQGKTLFSKDGVHPVATGHAYYLESIKAAWPELENAAAVDHSAKLAAAFFDARLEAAKMVSITQDMLSGTWRRLASNEQNGNFGPRFGEQPWFTETPGSKMRFFMRGSGCMVYDLVGPDCGQVWVKVDGVRRSAPVARFDAYCTYYRVGTLGAFSGTNGVYEIELELDANQPSRLPVKVQGVTDEELAGPKYDGTKWIAGRLMLVGDVISEEEAYPPVAADPDPSAWFHANVAAYSRWPRDASMAVRSTWTTNADSLADVASVPEQGVLEIASGSEKLLLEADVPRTLGDRIVFDAEVAMCGCEAADIPPVDPEWKASLIQVAVDGTRAYYGLGRNGATNEWVRLDGVVPPADWNTTVHVRMTFRRVRGETTVAYNVGGVDLSANGVTAIPVVADGVFSGVTCGGWGKVRSLAAHAAAGRGTLVRICSR